MYVLPFHGWPKGVFPVDCGLSILLTVLEMHSLVDVRQIINLGESNLFRIEGPHCSEIGLDVYNYEVNPEREDLESGEEKQAQSWR